MVAGQGTRRSARISVVMPSYRSERTIAGALEGLQAQREDDFETIVIDSSPADTVERIVRGRFPDVRFERCPERLPPHAARNLGAQVACGELIVFTDPDCRADPDWLDRLVAAHQRGHPIVGGAVEPAVTSWLAYGMHVCKFGPWMGGGPRGSRPLLPTANLMMSRWAWETVGPFRLLGWSGDAELCWRARAAGFELAFEPTAVVEHHEEAAFWSFWRERVRRGRAFGALRGGMESWSRARAAAQAAAAPAVAPLLLVRALRDAARAGRGARAVFTTPVQFAGYSAWALGEAQAHIRRVLLSSLP